MKHAVRNPIPAGCNAPDHLDDEHVGKFYRPNVAPANPAFIFETNNVFSSRKHSRRQDFLAGELAKRKYEDMTSCRIEDVEAGNDHELSSQLSFFREHKKRKPPEAAGSLMQVQDTTIQQVEGAFGENEFQGRTAESTQRSRSGSKLAVPSDICGESDLTAENHMAEESSRSSNNNNDSSVFESAAESASKGSKRDCRSVSSLGVLHCFLDRTDGGREVRMSTSREGPSHMTSLTGRNDTRYVTRTEGSDVMTNLEGAPESDPVTSHHLRSGSTKVSSSATNYPVPSQLWGRSSNQEWLQLSVGCPGEDTPAIANVKSDPASGLEGKLQAFGEGLINEERVLLKRKSATSTDFSYAGNRGTDSNIYTENSDTMPVERQSRRSSNAMPPKCEVFSLPNTTLNPATFRSVPISSLQARNATAFEAVPNVDKQDLCIFGRRLMQTGTARQELVLAPLSSSVTRKTSGNGSEKDNAMTDHVRDDSFELHRAQEDLNLDSVKFPRGNVDFTNPGVGRSEIHNIAGPSFNSVSMPATDIHFRSTPATAAGTAMDHDAFQFHRDNPPSSLSALMQRREDLRHGQVGYSWLPPSNGDTVPKLIPLAKSFQGWNSSELTSNAKMTAMSTHHGLASNSIDQQATTSSDEWGSLFRKISPKMLFQSQNQLPEGSSVALHSAGKEGNVGSQESLESLKRAIEFNIQRRPQSWPTPEAINLGSVASWCLNGSIPGVRGDAKLERFVGERSFMSSLLSDSVPLHSRFVGDQVNLSGKQPQRQSWQPAAGSTKLHQGNANVLQRPSPSTIGKQKFQVLPPGSRGTNHAGLWFILQSAESQNGEGRLPQISKAYLRIKDGKMPVSAVKKYLVSKLGLTSESEVEITCKGQPVVPSLPLQHVRDVIWFSSLTANNNKEQTSSGEKDESAAIASERRGRPPAAADRAAGPAAMFSKDILMVLTYRRHPRTLQLSTSLT